MITNTPPNTVEKPLDETSSLTRETRALPENFVSDHVEFAITTGTALKAGVGPGRKFQITPLGVRFVGQMTYEQWLDGMRALKLLKGSMEFCEADFVSQGRHLFGDERVAEALTQLEWDMMDVARSYAIGQTLLDLRVPELTSEHYYVLGQIEDEKDRRKWSSLAVQHELTALELKKSIEEGKVVRQEGINQQSGRGAGIANLQGLKFWFQRWEKQAGGHESILHWPVEKKKSWLDEMKPLLELARELEATL